MQRALHHFKLLQRARFTYRVGEVIIVADQALVKLAGEQGDAVYHSVVKKLMAAGQNLQANLRQENQDFIDVLDPRGDADDRDEKGNGR